MSCFSAFTNEEQSDINELINDTSPESKRRVLLLAIFPVRCFGCRKVELKLKKILSREEFAPLIQMHTILRWGHCLVHNPKLTKSNPNHFCPFLFAMDTQKHAQLIRQELTKIQGPSIDFFDKILWVVCNSNKRASKENIH
ncbi:hypothetical protein [Candidatus Similichlamydia epinepheli]|uniref:hypothetical protein n=1 Tax=Candidatus Similichlamydia epinepheli TaxID=1903953 RepID=UPI001300343A|nr:hypothetical protein [Candidatus Similichlamydia epinepheli]